MPQSLKIVAVLAFLFLSGASIWQSNAQLTEVQIAFMADVHLQDIYGKFQDSDYKGTLNPGNSEYVLARTMQSQLNSTRIYNENYFAFLAALDDVVRRKIQYVVLPGDFSDDGQPLNIRGLKRIIDHYTETYGIRFIATTGNHDPVRPYSKEAGKTDFLGNGGKPQAIMSKSAMFQPKSPDALPAVVTQDIRSMGYQEIISTLDNCGFFPSETDLYWGTPFSTYNFDSYNFNEASRQAQLDRRQYSIPPYFSSIPDVSYLVEPVRDLWFLAIDANVYLPKEQAQADPLNPAGYEGASIGYNNVLTHKKHLIEWVREVCNEAEKRGKTLIAFSHYPMVDFNDDATPHLKKLFGDDKMQLHRVPEESVARIFADAGIRLHFGGHMHINDTGIRRSEKGNTLINVQIPSLAAYIPAYKILTIHKRQIMEVETVVLDSVPRFNELFPLYEQEHAYLQRINQTPIWDKAILSAKNYHEYTSMHLKELVRNRILKSDWPPAFRNFFLNATGNDFLKLAAKSGTELPVQTSDFESWTGFEMIFDFYRLHSADKLALKDIGTKRMQQYQILLDAFLSKNTGRSENSLIYNDFREFATCFQHFLNGAPADHFQINLQSGEIIDHAKK